MPAFLRTTAALLAALRTPLLAAGAPLRASRTSAGAPLLPPFPAYRLGVGIRSRRGQTEPDHCRNCKHRECFAPRDCLRFHDLIHLILQLNNVLWRTARGFATGSRWYGRRAYVKCLPRLGVPTWPSNLGEPAVRSSSRARQVMSRVSSGFGRQPAAILWSCGASGLDFIDDAF
jgi:hypothetical protein